MGCFDDKIVSLWVITFDYDFSRTYIYTSLEKMKSAVGSHLLTVLPNSGEATAAVSDALSNLDHSIWSPIIVQGEGLSVRRLDLDRHNPIHRALADCYEYLGKLGLETVMSNQELRDRIQGLFS